jgi:PhnB protein
MAQTKPTVHPYLFFGGNCREAMEFYKTVFGGELTLTNYSEGPADVHSDPKANSEEMKNKIMHARLSGTITILASDNPNLAEDKNTGQFSLSLEGSEESVLRSYFEKLARNGIITSPLVQQFWGDTFGMVTDRYGINWMVNISKINS